MSQTVEQQLKQRRKKLKQAQKTNNLSLLVESYNAHINLMRQKRQETFVKNRAKQIQAERAPILEQKPQIQKQQATEKLVPDQIPLPPVPQQKPGNQDSDQKDQLVTNIAQQQQRDQFFPKNVHKTYKLYRKKVKSLNAIISQLKDQKSMLSRFLKRSQNDLAQQYRLMSQYQAQNQILKQAKQQIEQKLVKSDQKMEESIKYVNNLHVQLVETRNQLNNAKDSQIKRQKQHQDRIKKLTIHSKQVQDNLMQKIAKLTNQNNYLGQVIQELKVVEQRFIKDHSVLQEELRKAIITVQLQAVQSNNDRNTIQRYQQHINHLNSQNTFMQNTIVVLQSMQTSLTQRIRDWQMFWNQNQGRIIPTDTIKIKILPQNQDSVYIGEVINRKNQYQHKTKRHVIVKKSELSIIRQYIKQLLDVSTFGDTYTKYLPTSFVALIRDQYKKKQYISLRHYNWFANERRLQTRGFNINIRRIHELYDQLDTYQ